MATFHIEQFGCRATQADAAAIERQLRQRGYGLAADPARADVVVVNTCTVTAAADAQARAAIREASRRNPEARIIVTGCYAQRAPEDLAALPGVAWVVGNSHKHEIPRLIGEMTASEARSVPAAGFFPAAQLAMRAVSSRGSAKILTGDIFELETVLVAPLLGGEADHTRPTLKIQDGCNNRCSFCVIPFVRGRSRSLPPQRILDEVARLASAGYKEIVLSGINLGAYGRDLSPRVEFVDLLKLILDETSVERLRISSIEPMDVTRELVDLFGSTDRLAQHFHVPLQSGSDCILAAMHRWYRAEHYARRVELVRERLPHAAIGADIIAGFPGEADANHAATLDFIRRLPFTYLHVFSYSKRPGTEAAKLPNEVPRTVARRRASELRALSAEKAASFRQSQVGRRLRVLTLRATEESICGAWTDALSTNYLRVRVSGAWPRNEFLDVRVSGVKGERLVGRVEAEPSSESTYVSKMTCASACESV
jgi:threonylcarbamoyladenosine tRNA methylthiotransferase MtaB